MNTDAQSNDNGVTNEEEKSVRTDKHNRGIKRRSADFSKRNSRHIPPEVIQHYIKLLEFVKNYQEEEKEDEKSPSNVGSKREKDVFKMDISEGSVGKKFIDSVSKYLQEHKHEHPHLHLNSTTKTTSTNSLTTARTKYSRKTSLSSKYTSTVTTSLFQSTKSSAKPITTSFMKPPEGISQKEKHSTTSKTTARIEPTTKNSLKETESKSRKKSSTQKPSFQSHQKPDPLLQQSTQPKPTTQNTQSPNERKIRTTQTTATTPGDPVETTPHTTSQATSLATTAIPQGTTTEATTETTPKAITGTKTLTGTTTEETPDATTEQTTELPEGTTVAKSQTITSGTPATATTPEPTAKITPEVSIENTTTATQTLKKTPTQQPSPKTKTPHQTFSGSKRRKVLTPTNKPNSTRANEIVKIDIRITVPTTKQVQSEETKIIGSLTTTAISHPEAANNEKAVFKPTLSGHTNQGGAPGGIKYPEDYREKSSSIVERSSVPELSASSKLQTVLNVRTLRVTSETIEVNTKSYSHVQDTASTHVQLIVPTPSASTNVFSDPKTSILSSENIQDLSPPVNTRSHNEFHSEPMTSSIQTTTGSDSSHLPTQASTATKFTPTPSAIDVYFSNDLDQTETEFSDYQKRQVSSTKSPKSISHPKGRAASIESSQNFPAISSTISTESSRDQIQYNYLNTETRNKILSTISKPIEFPTSNLYEAVATTTLGSFESSLQTPSIDFPATAYEYNSNSVEASPEVWSTRSTSQTHSIGASRPNHDYITNATVFLEIEATHIEDQSSKSGSLKSPIETQDIHVDGKYTQASSSILLSSTTASQSLHQQKKAKTLKSKDASILIQKIAPSSSIHKEQESSELFRRKSIPMEPQSSSGLSQPGISSFQSSIQETQSIAHGEKESSESFRRKSISMEPQSSSGLSQPGISSIQRSIQETQPIARINESVPSERQSQKTLGLDGFPTNKILSSSEIISEETHQPHQTSSISKSGSSISLSNNSVNIIKTTLPLQIQSSSVYQLYSSNKIATFESENINDSKDAPTKTHLTFKSTQVPRIESSSDVHFQYVESVVNTKVLEFVETDADQKTEYTKDRTTESRQTFGNTEAADIKVSVDFYDIGSSDIQEPMVTNVFTEFRNYDTDILAIQIKSVNTEIFNIKSTDVVRIGNTDVLENTESIPDYDATTSSLGKPPTTVKTIESSVNINNGLISSGSASLPRSSIHTENEPFTNYPSTQSSSSFKTFQSQSVNIANEVTGILDNSDISTPSGSNADSVVVTTIATVTNFEEDLQTENTMKNTTTRQHQTTSESSDLLKKKNASKTGTNSFSTTWVHRIKATEEPFHPTISNVMMKTIDANASTEIISSNSIAIQAESILSHLLEEEAKQTRDVENEMSEIIYGKHGSSELPMIQPSKSILTQYVGFPASVIPRQQNVEGNIMNDQETVLTTEATQIEAFSTFLLETQAVEIVFEMETRIREIHYKSTDILGKSSTAEIDSPKTSTTLTTTKSTTIESQSTTTTTTTTTTTSAIGKPRSRAIATSQSTTATTSAIGQPRLTNSTKNHFVSSEKEETTEEKLKAYINEMIDRKLKMIAAKVSDIIVIFIFLCKVFNDLV